MPKAKLHSKGKVTSIQKPCNKDGSEDVAPEEAMRQFQLELIWCIQQLERTLREKKGPEKRLQEAWKVLAVLKNNNQPIVRKRQLMRTQFGDYRAKMQAEEKKIAKMASKMKITDSPAPPKATFLRKSVFLTTGKEAFRFNFNLTPEHEDTATGPVPTEPESTSAGSTELKSIEPESSKPANTAVTKANETPTSNGKTELDCSGDSKDVKSHNSNFKFSFTNSEFKFNFNNFT